MKLLLVDEYNDKGHLVYIENLPGAYVRGATLEEALSKLDSEAERWMLWAGMEPYRARAHGTVSQEKPSTLAIEDADSDVLFESEKAPLTAGEYVKLRHLALKSAEDFLTLYQSIPDKEGTTLPRRSTFYGDVPVTARQMYEHTKNVNSYYFDQLGIDADNGPDILTCRIAGFELLERQPDFLGNGVFDGSYDEQWTVRKLCRRFIWHDRIHARAMYRMASALCGSENISDPFFFGSL